MGNKKPFLPALFLLTAAFAAFAADESVVQAWFRTESRAKPYSGIEARILDLFSEAGTRKLPEQVLLGKLKEGAAKRVDPERLLVGLKEELERLTSAQGIVEGSGIVFPDPAARQAAVKDMSVYLLGGLGVEVLKGILAQAILLSHGYADAISCCDALVKLREMSTVDDKGLLRIGRALLASRVPPSGYKTIPSLFLRAKVQRIAEADILDDIVLRTLESGGGLVQMEEELVRRARKR